MLIKHIFSAFCLLAISADSVWAQCNGHEELCGKRYDQVAFLTTHNAFNAEEDGFALPNHTYGITRQLNDGVRGLMIDVYDEGGIATVYHSLAFLGTTTLESNLTEIKDFLDANQNEVVTIIFECYADFGLIQTAFLNTGIIEYAHSQSISEEWPTLQDMIASGKRLVVLSDRDDAPAQESWYHYVWDHAVETPFSNSSNSDFTCEFNRGNPSNALFILNHFATDPTLGVGRTDLSELANAFDFFYERALQCQLETGKFPNFPTIDFHQLGEPLRVVDSLNGIPSSVGIADISEHSFSVSPNPGRGLFRVDQTGERSNYVIFNISGKRILQGSLIHSPIIDLTDQPQGIYFLCVSNSKGTETIKLVNLPK